MSTITPEGTKSWFAKAGDEDLKTKLALLFQEKDNPFYDMKVKMNGVGDEPEEVTWAHKLIMAMSSPVMAARLYGDTKVTPEGDIACRPLITVEISYYPPSIVKLMLEFMYTDDIKTNLSWKEIGPLMYAAEEFAITKLASFCNEILLRLTCDKVVRLFQHLAESKKDPEDLGFPKFPKFLFKVLMRHCLSYILRNADVILRATSFKELSIEIVETIIGSDYFYCAEIDVYNGVKSWAKHQCRKQGIKNANVEDLRRALRRPHDSDNDLGLLKLVRFPLMEFSAMLQVSDSKRCLLPDAVYESLNEYSIMGEGDAGDIFSVKSRQLTSEKDEEFLIHLNKSVEQLLVNGEISSTYSMIDVQKVETSSNPPNGHEFLRDSGEIHQRNAEEFAHTECAQTEKVTGNKNLVEQPDLPENQSLQTRGQDDCEPTGLMAVPSGLVEMDVITESPMKIINPLLTEEQLNSQQDPVETYPLLIHELQKDQNLSVESKDDIESSKSDSLKDVKSPGLLESRSDTQENFLPSNLQDLPVKPWRGQNLGEEIALKQSATPLSRAQRVVRTVSESRAVDQNQLFDRQENSCSRTNYAHCKSVTEVYAEVIASVLQQNPTGKRKANDLLITEASKSRRVDSDASDFNEKCQEISDEVVRVCREDFRNFSQIVSFCANNPHAQKLVFDNVILQLQKFQKKQCKSVHLKELKKFYFQANLSTQKKSSVLTNLQQMSLMDYLFFYCESDDLCHRLTDLWDRNVKVQLVFGDYTVFCLQPNLGKITISYTRPSGLVCFDTFKAVNLKTLNIGNVNCTGSLQKWLNPQNFLNLEDLKVYLVKGFQCDTIVKQCIQLKSFMFWPDQNGTHQKFHLENIKTRKLQTLAVNSCMIKYTPTTTPLEVVQRLSFRNCSWDTKFEKDLPTLFPNVKFIMVCSHYWSPSPHLLEILLSMKSLQKIILYNFDLKQLDEFKNRNLRDFLGKTSIKRYLYDQHFSFKLVRDSQNQEKWNGRNITGLDLSKLVYVEFGCASFFTPSAWSHDLLEFC